MSESPIFALAIHHDTSGKNGAYKLESMNVDIPTEVVLTKVRHWLKIAESEYHHKFKTEL